MKSNKGQALVEFVMVLPVLLIIIMYIVDSSKIAVLRYKLENDMDVIVNLYSNKNNSELDSYVLSNGIDISYAKNGSMTSITISRQTNYVMPLLREILGSKISTERTIYETLESDVNETQIIT